MTREEKILGDLRDNLCHENCGCSEEGLACVQVIAADELERVYAEITQLRTALEDCASNWFSRPGTVMSAQTELTEEFKRRMMVAANALDKDHSGRSEG